MSAFFFSRVVDPYSFFPDPDPDPEFDVGDQYGSGSTSPIEYGSDPDPDPQPCSSDQLKKSRF
jgi:hypothetical protein